MALMGSLVFGLERETKEWNLVGNWSNLSVFMKTGGMLEGKHGDV